MDRNDACRLLESVDGEFGRFCLDLEPKDPVQAERVAWLALWFRDPGSSPIPEGDMEDREAESQARLEAVIIGMPFFLDQAPTADDQDRDKEMVAEICLWARTHLEHYGYWGVMPLGWLKRVCHRKVRSFGRLQVEELQFQWDVEHEEAPTEGERVLDLHIPATGRLSPHEVDVSLDKARAFYEGRGIRYFTCHSWLLTTNLAKVLDKGSNLLGFSNRFTLIRESDDEAQALERVFGFNVDETNPLPQKTRLQRSMAKAREEGLSFGMGLGVIPF